MLKTNVMRILDKNKIEYKTYSYVDTDAVSGMEVASVLGQNPNQVFKTLVTVSNTKNYYIFVIPVNRELNFKKCAAVVGEKSIEMIHQKELLALTGYIHGGCSPIGMKKYFKTIIQETNFDEIIFSAGKIGYQVQVHLCDLKKIVPYEFGDVCY